MTRTHAAKRLLQHGPLMFEEFQAITGWSSLMCHRTLKNLREQGIARNGGAHNRRTVWELTRAGMASL